MYKAKTSPSVEEDEDVAGTWKETVHRRRKKTRQDVVHEQKTRGVENVDVLLQRQ